MANYFLTVKKQNLLHNWKFTKQSSKLSLQNLSGKMSLGEDESDNLLSEKLFP